MKKIMFALAALALAGCMDHEYQTYVYPERIDHRYLPKEPPVLTPPVVDVPVVLPPVTLPPPVVVAPPPVIGGGPARGCGCPLTLREIL
jgi:hypothetical protein